MWGVDAWISLGVAATRTSRIRLGTMLTPPSRRRPWELASQVATVDRLSEGRVTLSVGLGAIDSGFDAFGEESDRRIRAELLDECLDIVTGLWAGQPFSYEGKHYRCSRPSSRRSARRCSSRGCRSGASACSAGRSRWRGRCAGTASSRSWPAESTRRSPRSAPIREELGDREYDIVIEGEGNEHSPAAWAAAGATWWIESLWSAVNEVDAALAANDRLLRPPR